MFSDWSRACCECIAKHESGGNGNAVNHNSNGSGVFFLFLSRFKLFLDDVGLFQINNINWGACSG